MSILTMLTRNTAKILAPKNRFLTSLPDRGDESRKVYLTFDDGPDPVRTPAVLQHLDAINARATFFILGNQIDGNEEIVQRILEAGHAIGSHGWEHLRATEVSAAEWLQDTDRGIAAVETVTGQACRLFRPAYGALTPITMIGLLRRNVQVVLWTQDVHDYQLDSRDSLQTWFQVNEPAPGSIVLMHDTIENTAAHLGAGIERWSDGVTFDALPMPAVSAP